MARLFSAAELAALKRQFFDSLSGEATALLSEEAIAASEAAQSTAEDALDAANEAVSISDSGRNLDWNGASRVRVPTPTDDAGAATKLYVDGLTGGTATEAYVDSSVAGATAAAAAAQADADAAQATADLAVTISDSSRVLNWAAATSVSVPAPTVDAHAATKKYIDDLLGDDTVVTTLEFADFTTPANKWTLTFNASGVLIEAVETVP